MALARINAIQDLRTNAGPGIRTEVFWHGCSRGCPGCINDWTKDYPFYTISVNQVIKEIQRLGNNNVSFSGGEPLEQPIALAEILRKSYRFKGRNGSILIFTGYSMEEIMQSSVYYSIRLYVDYLVTDPFIIEQLNLEAEDRIAGSSNQRMWVRSQGIWSTARDNFAREWQQVQLDEYGRWIQSEQLS